jgi:growth arrest-specific protein 8
MIDGEERNINLFQQERDRINYIWMIQKKKIEDTRAELVNKQREKEDLSEKHKIEKKLYYQRIKYQMLSQQDENVELQKNAEVALKQTEDLNRVKERDYKYDLRSLSKTHKEQEVLQNDFMNALKKDSIKEIHELKSEYELKEYQIRRFFREKMKEMKNNASEKRNKKLEEITNKKAKEIKKITEDHANAFNNMKNYYSDLNKKNLNNLKSIAAHYNKQLNRQEILRKKKLNRLQQKSKIEVPLEKLKAKIEELLNEEKKCLENYYDLTGKNQEYNSKNIS